MQVTGIYSCWISRKKRVLEQEIINEVLGQLGTVLG